MKRALYILLILHSAFQIVLLSQPNLVWQSRYNGPANLQDNAYKIKCDNSGNVYVTGRSLGIGSGYDFCTIKYNSNGSQIWIQRYNGPVNGDDGAVSLDIDNDNNIYVTGYSLGTSENKDFCTIKYDAGGNLVWIKRYDDGFDDIPAALVTDNSGNIIVTGSVKNDYINNSEKYLTIKYDNNGNILWQRKYEATVYYPDIPADLTIDINGNIIVTGTSTTPENWDDILTLKYSSSGEQLWVNRFSLPSSGASTDWGNAVISDANGNVFVTGYSENYAGKMVTIKYSAAGVQQWYRLYDSNAVDQGYDIDVYENFIYVTGYTGGRFLIVKYDSNGNLVWDRISREFQSSFGLSAEVDDLGSIYATGYCLSIPSWDILTLKYDLNGNLKWYKTYNGLNDSNDYANDLCLDNFGNLYVAGWSRGFNSSSDYITLKYDNLTAVNSYSNDIPPKFSLSQNYPNPFNPSTTINFAIPLLKGVTGEAGRGVYTYLKIYDIIGSEVKTLVNQQLTPGTYSVDWDASNYPSGVYFYRLTAGEFIKTNKMILLK